MLDCPPGRAIASHPTKGPGSNPGKTNVFQGGSRGQTSFRRRQRRCCRGPRHAAGIRSGCLSVACHYLHQSIPAGRRCRRGRPAAGCDARAHSQAALRNRNESGRRRPGRRSGRRDRKARRLHAAHPYRLDFRLRRSRQAVRPPAQVHARRFHSDRAADIRANGPAGQRPDAVQDRQGAGRRRQEEPGQAHLQLVRTLRRAASADRTVHEGGRASR